MPSLRPQHRRSNGAVGATLMRSANQFSNARRLGTDAQGKDGVWKARGKPNDAKQMRLPRIGRRGTYAPHSERGATGMSHARAGAATRTSCAWAGTARSCTPKLPRRLAQERDGAGDPADTLARWRRLAQSGVAAHKPRALAGTPPLAPLLPHPTRNTQTKHLGMARFARRA